MSKLLRTLTTAILALSTLATMNIQPSIAADPVVLEPTSTSNGTITTFKFPATMDGGTLGCGRGQIAANESLMRLEYGGPQWRGDQCYDLFYIYYGDYRNALRNYTANQLISARQVFTWNSGTTVNPKSVLSSLVNSQWNESTIIYNSAPGFGSFYESSLSSIEALALGSSFSVNSIDGVKEHFNGTSNFGFTLRRSSGTATREEGVGEGAPRIHTREATTPEYRPYLEVIIDSSRPTYPAPIDPPSGLTLSPIAGGINLAWSSTPANTDQVVVEFTCSISGASRTSVTASSRQVTRLSLQAGERCIARAQSLNSGGMSPFSMSTNESIVQGAAPNAGPSLSISASGSTVTASLVSLPTGATEFTITLSCSQSGQKIASFDASRTSNTFTGLTVGENCSAFATSKNQWGNSSPGPITNSVILQGNAPSSISFVAESIQTLQLKISWNMIPTGVTSIDATISCTRSGLLKKSSNPAAMSILFTGLEGGETCSPSVATSNQFGSSASLSVADIKILATRLDQPTITTVDVSVPTKATIRWTSPSEAENLEFIIKCPNMSDYTFSSSTQYNTRTISGGEGGMTCTVVARAVNSSTVSDFTNTYSFTFKGLAPTSAPQGVNIIAGLKNVIVQWDSVPNATEVTIDLICSKTGKQNLTTSASTKSISFNASPGDSCYAILAAANAWGASSNKSNTKSVSLTGGIADSKVTKQLPSNKAPSKTPKKTVAPSKAKTSLICIKGSQQQTITAVLPKCPTGWFKKPTITKQ